MKVRDLKKGMLLTCLGPNDCFSTYGINDTWLTVREKPKRGSSHVKICLDTIMIYLGTKKDIDIKMNWTDRFVLIDNQIVGVDPAAWRKIRPV